MATADIFVLELEGGNYWVSCATSLIPILRGHFSGNSFQPWVRKHPPVRVVKIARRRPVIEVRREVVLFAANFGVDKVRGGEYRRVDLSPRETEIYATEALRYTGCCHFCAEFGHAGEACTELSDYLPSPEEYLPFPSKVDQAQKLIRAMLADAKKINRCNLETLDLLISEVIKT